MDPIVSLRPPSDPPDHDEFDAIVAVSMAQDTGWWGSPDGDADDVRSGLDRARDATGSLADRVRLAVDDGSGAVIGVGMLFDHGQTNLAADPTATSAGVAVAALLDWLVEAGGTSFESPAQDGERLQILRDRGIVPTRSGFELERPATIDDLEPPTWPDGVTLSTFSQGVDEQEVHDLVYSVWTDVAGHTYRPIDEWRSLFVDGPWFDPDLVVMARRADGGLAGVALSRTFSGNFGWVSQIAVGRPDRGIGLGRALLVESLRRLAGVPGVANVGLSVEADNANALGLYRSVGLEVTREWVHCSAPH